MPGALSIDQLATAVRRLAGGDLDARIIGDGTRTIVGVATLEHAGADHLSFLVNPRYRRLAAATRAGALVLAEADRAALFPDGSDTSVLIVSESSYAWFAFAAQVLAPQARPEAGCAPSAIVHPGAQVDPTSWIGPLAVIEEGARIGPGTQVGAGCTVGRGAWIGEATRLYAGVRIYHGCRIGARCILHSGCVIGADGFGFAPFRGRWVKIPQTGAVLIGDDVEIGAGTTIDRGAIGDTVIEDGVKIDNLVQIGHNCRIGAHSAIAGCVGIAGSATIGRRCQLGGASMIQGHITIADDSIISGATAITRDIRQAGFYTGIYPFMLNREWERNAVLLRHLDELRERIRRLEASVRAQRTESDR
ncbi:MAG TPA: UDP-3-O-(3-hydroxymyristoyl)glucosamine N-acyltransferase [Burkholderiaceae bacterium]|jgi:UDP-3-O-[3-hydroxymyristoyl] glucosamine N-acyltransferase|nr:UDP-3-O-(3-hydroxymyristoyl)glucosamine N-acyltransferase [Burkholderiaceae bacterium]